MIFYQMNDDLYKKHIKKEYLLMSTTLLRFACKTNKAYTFYNLEEKNVFGIG